MHSNTFCLLIGIEYTHSRSRRVPRLKGISNDVHNLSQFLQHACHVPANNIVVMCDAWYEPQDIQYPTLKNIMTTLNHTVAQLVSLNTHSQFILFIAAHGYRVQTGGNTTACTMVRPADWEHAGYVHPHFLQYPLQKLPPTCQVTVMLDVCFAGNFFSLPYNMLTTPNETQQPRHPLNAPCVVLSSCAKHEKSVEAQFMLNDTQTNVQGPLVTSLCHVFQTPQPTLLDLVTSMQLWLRTHGITQTLQCFSNSMLCPDTRLFQTGNAKSVLQQ